MKENSKVIIANFAFDISESFIDFEVLKRAVLYFDKVFLYDNTIQHWAADPDKGYLKFETFPPESLEKSFRYFEQLKVLIEEGIVEKFNLTFIRPEFQFKIARYVTKKLTHERFKLAFYSLAAMDFDAALTLVRKEDQEILSCQLKELFTEIPGVKKHLKKPSIKTGAVALSSLHLESLPDFAMKTFFDALEIRDRLRKKGYFGNYKSEMRRLAKEIKAGILDEKFYKKMQDSIIPQINKSISGLKTAIRKDYWFKKFRSLANKSVSISLTLWGRMDLLKVVVIALGGAIAWEALMPSRTDKHSDNPYNFLLEIH